MESIKKYVDSTDHEKLIQLANFVKYPALVAHAISLFNINIEFYKLLCLSSKENKDFSISLSRAAYKQFNTDWIEWIKEVNRTENELFIIDLLLGLEDNLCSWEIVQKFGSHIDKSYWERKTIYALRDNEDGLEFAIEKCLLYRSAIESIQLLRNNYNLSFQKIIEILNQSTREINSDEEMAKFIDVHLVQQILDHLFSIVKISDPLDHEKLSELALVEIKYLNVFSYRYIPKAINEYLKLTPSFFIELICIAYKNSESETQDDISEEQKAIAPFAYKILNNFNSIPGEESGVINQETLKSWIAEVIALGKKNYREKITYVKLGDLLVHMKSDDNEIWPSLLLSEIIEELSSSKFEDGLLTGKFNLRRTVTRVMYEGGQQEREIAEKYKEWASQREQFPRTKEMLLKAADEFEDRAIRIDNKAKEEKLKNRYR